MAWNIWLKLSSFFSSSAFVHDQQHNRNRKVNLNWFGTVFEQHSAKLVLPFDRSAPVIPASASRNRRAFRQLRRSGFSSVDSREPGRRRRRGGWRSRRWRRRWSRCRRRRRRRAQRERHLRAAVFRFERKF